jgi:hypothetical protein
MREEEGQVLVKLASSLSRLDVGYAETHAHPRPGTKSFGLFRFTSRTPSALAVVNALPSGLQRPAAEENAKLLPGLESVLKQAAAHGNPVPFR